MICYFFADDGSEPTVFLKKDSMGFCSKCKEYLSVGPLRTLLGKPVCGRCREAEAVPADFYDKLAQHMYFPCINDRYGCTALLAWGSVLAHEENCRFSPAICPAMNCFEKIQKDKILVHFESNHRNLILPPENHFKLPFNCGSQKGVVNRILVWKEQIFVLKMIFSFSSCFLGILYWESLDTEELRYNMCIEDDKKQKKHLGGNPIVEYEAEIDRSFMIEVDMKDIKRTFDADTLLCTVSLEQEYPEEDSFNESLLAEVECPICTEYMKTPIWMCSVGHSICSACKSKVRQCPTCQSVLTDNRNFTLEKVIEHIEFPCKFKDLGCCFRGSLASGRLHEMECSYAGKHEIKCYIKNCSWSGRQSKMFSHLLEKHRQKCCVNNYSKSLDLSKLGSYLFFMESNNQFFEIHIKIDATYIKFCVKLMQTHAMKYSRYQFFINFKDLNGYNRFLKLNSERVIPPFNHPISIPHDLIRRFLKGSLINFELYVVEC
ncbi:hypothetical protein JTB14_032240 [Gonioctena quinquepunctata]|nr:hypothetical protein JTB14_032240 [Gonioctena quinquepunctata]